MSEQQLDCALDLMRRLPPQHIEKNLSQVRTHKTVKVTEREHQTVTNCKNTR